MTNTRNYRTPTGDDDPNVPYWNDLLAQDVANDVDKLEDVSPQKTGAQGVSFAITDSTGRRSWIEVSQAGGMTDHAVSVVAAALASATGAQVDAKIATLPIPASINSDATGLSFTLVDQNGRRSWLEAGPDGRPTSASAQIIKAALAALGSETVGAVTMGTGSGLAFVVVDQDGRKSELQVGTDGKLTGPFVERVISVASAAAVEAANPVATLPIAEWGDSMTAPGSGYGDKLATEAGVSVRNYGIGGQGTQSISARQGGVPATVTFPNNLIPASGSATVTASAVLYSNPSGTGTSSGPVTIAGVHGTLTRDNPSGVLTFTRDTAGTAVWCPPTTPIISDESTLNRGQIAVIWSGRNSFLLMTPEAIVSHIRAMVDHMTAGRKRYLVLEIAPADTETTGTANRIKLDTLNAQLAAAFPYNFVPVAQYLRGPALADLGLTPTSQDTTDIANGITPVSLRGDNLHLNANGNTAAARLVSNTLKAKGWI